MSRCGMDRTGKVWRQIEKTARKIRISERLFKTKNKAMKPKAKQEKQVIDIVKIAMGRLNFCVLGTSPLVINRLAEKARQELLFPARKKNSAERAVTLKHNPPEEYRSSIYQTLDDAAPTRIIFPGSAFASVIADTAVDIPGSSRAQMERLTRVADLNVAIFGVPRLYMAVVRTLGMNKTPDIRTRALLPEWACQVQVTYVKGLVTERSVTNLFAAGGTIGGIGDGRGKMGFGQFRLVQATDKDFQRIIRTQGRKAQDEAIENPVPYDHETEDLYSWFQEELVIREKLGEDESAPLVRSGNNEPVEELV